MKHITIKISLILSLLFVTNIASPLKAYAVNDNEIFLMANDREAKEIYEFFTSILYKCVYSEVEADQLDLYDFDMFCNQIGVSKDELTSKYWEITKKCANVVERYNLDEGDCASCNLSEEEKIGIIRSTLTDLKADYAKNGVINLPKIPEPAPEQVQGGSEIICDAIGLSLCLAVCGSAAGTAGPAAPVAAALCAAYCVYCHCGCATYTTGGTMSA